MAAVHHHPPQDDCSPRWAVQQATRRPATTVSHIHRALRKAPADAVDVEQLLAANPAARSKRPRNAVAEPVQVWTAHKLGTFLATSQGHRLFAFYRLAAYTGARRGELLYLRWEAFDLDAAEVRLCGSTAVVRGQRVEGTTKGGRSRTISLDRDTVTALMTKLIKRHNGSVAPPARPLPQARLHDLRHLHATTLLLAGVPVHVVAARLGHADPAVTLRVYSHVLREHPAGVSDIFARAVNGSR